MTGAEFVDYEAYEACDALNNVSSTDISAWLDVIKSVFGSILLVLILDTLEQIADQWCFLTEIRSLFMNPADGIHNNV